MSLRTKPVWTVKNWYIIVIRDGMFSHYNFKFETIHLRLKTNHKLILKSCNITGHSLEFMLGQIFSKIQNNFLQYIEVMKLKKNCRFNNINY